MFTAERKAQAVAIVEAAERRAATAALQVRLYLFPNEDQPTNGRRELTIGLLEENLMAWCDRKAIERAGSMTALEALQDPVNPDPYLRGVKALTTQAFDLLTV